MVKRKHLLPILLYSLPIVFFIISYFLLTTSGEDIWQGANHLRAGTPPSPINDAITAFNYNSRITDMYAWAVIDFFDYQFSFGPDIIFRLIDVFMASATFYLTTYMIIGHKPRLTLKDSLIYCLTFLVFIITPFGRPFYYEFSMVHNYVPLALTTLLFSIPYINLIRNNSPKKHLILLSIGMTILGIYFGMASAITPLAFLGALILYCIIKRKTLTRPPLWFYTGLIGIVTGYAICWLAGNGVDHYTNPTTAAMFDYVSLDSIFNNPSSSIPKILWHEVYNFGTFLLPLIACYLVGIIYCNKRKQFFTLEFYKNLPTSTKRVALSLILFIVIHILGATLVKAPPRLLIPAYLSGLIILIHLLMPYFNYKFLIPSVVVFTTITIVIHTAFLSIYHQRASEVLTKINQCNCTEICVNPSRIAPPKIKVINLSQANILVDWGAPEVIYGKNVTFCK